MERDDIIGHGTSGTVTWTLYEDGELHFAPADGVSGTLGSYGRRNEIPWDPYRGEITSITSEGEIIIGKDLTSFFSDCTALTDVDLTGWTIGEGRTDMNGMFAGTFYDCSSLKEIDLTPLGSWDTSAVTDMSVMFFLTFGECDNLTEIDLTPLQGWGTSAVKDMHAMFSGCFYSCINLTEIDLAPLGRWGISDAADMSQMFYLAFGECDNLKEIDLAPLWKWDTPSEWDADGIFDGLCDDHTRVIGGGRFVRDYSDDFR